MAIPLEDEIFYPESDGEPMAETEEHLEEIVYVWEALKTRFEAEADVFVGADMFLYFREGDPRAVVAPDGFVVKGASEADLRRDAEEKIRALEEELKRLRGSG